MFCYSSTITDSDYSKNDKNKWVFFADLKDREIHEPQPKSQVISIYNSI